MAGLVPALSKSGPEPLSDFSLRHLPFILLNLPRRANGLANASAMIFISYAKEDHDYACQLYLAFKAAGLNPWMDKPPPPHEAEGLKVGQRWKHVLTEKLQAASHIALLLSPRSVRKRGYVQTEFRTALNLMNEMPDGQVFVLPIVSEPCDIPSLQVGQINLLDLQWEEVKAADISDFTRRLAAEIKGTP